MNYKLQIKKPNNRGPASRRQAKASRGGYTIIETMISIAVFLIVIMIGMTALLNVNLIHKKSQDMRSILDNLSFIMEDMSRNLRTGYDYHCIDDGDVTATYPHDCINGAGISFKSTFGDQWVYAIYPDGSIQKSVNNGNYFITLNSSDIKINTSLSSFTVIGAEPPGISKDRLQPYVTIKLVGEIVYKDITTSFSLQTSVSQRLIDNVPK